jgi:hypothetical protein
LTYAPSTNIEQEMKQDLQINIKCSKNQGYFLE